MDRSESTWLDSVTGQATFQFETVRNAPIILGGGEGAPDREGPETRFCINVDAKGYDPDQMEFSRDVALQIWITPTQLAAIVKAFFSGMLWHTPRVYRELLERLLRKRWQVMTSSIYREEISGIERVKPYHKLRT